MKRIFIILLLLSLFNAGHLQAGIVEKISTAPVSTRKVEPAPVSVRKVTTISAPSNIQRVEKKGTIKKELKPVPGTNVTLDVEPDRPMMKSEPQGLVETKEKQVVTYVEPEDDYVGSKVVGAESGVGDLRKRLDELEKRIGALEKKLGNVGPAAQGQPPTPSQPQGYWPPSFRPPQGEEPQPSRFPPDQST